jgi:hypothetical protein
MSRKGDLGRRFSGAVFDGAKSRGGLGPGRG